MQFSDVYDDDNIAGVGRRCHHHVVEDVCCGESLNSPCYRVEHVEADGNVRFETRDGKPLLRECGFSFKKRSDGGPDAESFVVSQSWRLGADEPVYGLGIWQDESISRLGKKKKMYQENPEDCVPILQSVRGWGLFWDNSSPLDYCEDGGVMTFGGEVGDAIDYYFMYGGTSDGVVRQIRWLTGEVPMQPKWTLGYYISRERYKSWAEAIDVVRGHRRRGIPRRHLSPSAR